MAQIGLGVLNRIGKKGLTPPRTKPRLGMAKALGSNSLLQNQVLYRG